MKSLRRLRLNLDFHEDHGPYCSEWDVRDAWFTKLTGEIGWEIVETLEKHCPLLQSVELLYHTISTSTWVEFHPCRCADPRFVLDDNDPEREYVLYIPSCVRSLLTLRYTTEGTSKEYGGTVDGVLHFPKSFRHHDALDSQSNRSVPVSDLPRTSTIDMLRPRCRT